MLYSTNFSHAWVVVGAIAVLALMVLAVIVTVRSRAMTTRAKVVWTLIVLFLPICGLVAWALVWFTGGRQAAKKARTA
jgi:hypothetical protein